MIKASARTVLTVLLTLVGFWAEGNDCLENRGAMDFGSGTTKILAVTVDRCEKRILKVLFEDRLPLAFNEAFEKSVDQKIPEKFWQEAVGQIQPAVVKLRAQNIQKISAVATAVFRSAQNGRAVIAAMGQRLGLSIEIISQEQEAELGFWSVLAVKGGSPQGPEIIVWDIGGGSMQMFAWNQGRPKIYKGDLASVSFKNEILKTLQFKDPKTQFSPNPLARQKTAAVQLAKNHAVLHVPSYFKKLPPDTRWMGIGGVLAMSVQKQVDPEQKIIQLEALANALDRQAELGDDKLAGDYKISDVSNLALVLGYMRALGISQLETVPAALGQGLIYKNLH